MISALYLTDRKENKRTLTKLSGTVIKLERMENKAVGADEFDLIILDANPDTCRQLQEHIVKRHTTGLEEVVLGLTIGEESMFSQPEEDHLMLRSSESEEVSPLLSRAVKPSDLNDDKINMSIIEPFIDSTINVFETMINVNAIKKDIFLKEKYSLFGDVSGVIGLSGETEGVVAITFPKKLGYHLVSRMVNCEESDLVIEDVHDGIGEIVNMVTGAAKGSLSEAGYKFSISVPTIITGYGHQLAHPRGEPVFVLIFEVDEQPFAVQLCISLSGQVDIKKKVGKNRQSQSSTIS